jgi:CheY-like chemotaxis protein
MKSFHPTALIVDDNYFNRDLCVLALEHVGFEVTQATNGLEATSLLEQQDFTMLVLDLAMPELDGIGVMREIQKRALNQNMSIVVMTANPHMATDEVELRADLVVYKPIDINEFARLAERLVKSRTEQ